MINWNGIFCAGVQHDNQTTAGSLDFAWIEEKKEKKKTVFNTCPKRRKDMGEQVKHYAAPW